MQRDRRRALRGHCRAGVLLRGRRVALHPTDPGECQSLPHERSGAQRSQTGKLALGQQAEGRRSQIGRLWPGHRSARGTASLVWQVPIQFDFP